MTKYGKMYDSDQPTDVSEKEKEASQQEEKEQVRLFISYSALQKAKAIMTIYTAWITWRHPFFWYDNILKSLIMAQVMMSDFTYLFIVLNLK